MSFRRTLFLFLLIGTTAPALSQDRVTLRLVDWASLDEMAIDESTIAAFKNRYPSLDVLYEPNPGYQYEEKILTGLATDEPPDVFLLDSKLIPTFTNKKVLLDLEPYIRQLGIDSAQWFSNVYSIARKGRGMYALPKGFTPLMMFYNKKLFDDARIPYPESTWNWNDYVRIAKQLTKDLDGDGTPDQYGTAFTNYYFYWIPWVWTAGGDVVDPEGRRATGFLNSPRTESALQFLIDLRQTHGVAPDAGSWIQAEKTGSNVALFSSGKIGMIVDGHWRMPIFERHRKEGTLDPGVVSMPRFPDGGKVNVLYESGWCVPVNAKHPKEAALLAAFMAGEVACEIRSAGRLEIPSNITAARRMVDSDTLGNEKAFVHEVQYCRQPWGSRIERFSEIEWTLQDAVDEVMINGKPLHETMTAYAGKVDEELERIRANEEMEFKPISAHSEILQILFLVATAVLATCAVLYFRATRTGSRRSRRQPQELRTAFGFLAPSLLHLTIFIGTPIVFAAYLSMHRWDMVVPDQPFVGGENFVQMASDPTFWNALKNTFIYSLNVPIGMLISLAVAVMLHGRLKGVGFLRLVYFLPGVTSFVAIALVWMWIYHPSFGAANVLLQSVGIPPLQWLNSAQTAMLSIIIFSVWLGFGYQMLIFLAGLQGIPEELQEAARIDGAGSWQRFRHVTLPMLKPATLFVLVTSMIASFQVFTTVYVMTAGGPVRSTDVFVYHIYQAAWEQLRMGYAAAMSWVLFVLIMVATWIQFKVMGRQVEYH